MLHTAYTNTAYNTTNNKKNNKLKKNLWKVSYSMHYNFHNRCICYPVNFVSDLNSLNAKVATI